MRGVGARRTRPHIFLCARLGAVKWSRKWLADPPAGTVVLGDEDHEVYVGGDWHPA